MGMSKHIIAYISDQDPIYQKHANVLKACISAEVLKLPKETAEYFDSEIPEKYLLEKKLEINLVNGVEIMKMDMRY